jgi:exodeoxyribonuclease-5
LLVRLRDEATARRRPREARSILDVLDKIKPERLELADLSPDQKAAYDSVLTWYKQHQDQPEVLSLGGYAGCGKTTLIAVLVRELSEGTRRGIAFCAFTGKAASVLRGKLAEADVIANREEGSRNYVGTIHSLIYEPQIGSKGEVSAWKKRDRETVEDLYSLIVVDEASMVSDELRDDLLSFGLPILAVGDHGQLSPVNGYGSLMIDPDLRLEKVHRHALDNPILKLSLDIRQGGDLPKDLKQSDQVRLLRGADEVEAELSKLRDSLGQWNDDGFRLDPLDIVSLTYTNRMRQTINGFVRSVMHQRDMSSSPPVRGDQVVCLKNQSGVYNGMRGVIESDVEDKSIWYRATTYFPDDELEVRGSFLRTQLGRDKTFGDLQDLNDTIRPHEVQEWRDAGLLFDYGYALTVHKSQGSQFKHVFLYYDRISGVPADDFRRWVYTAATRATECLYIVTG